MRSTFACMHLDSGVSSNGRTSLTTCHVSLRLLHASKWSELQLHANDLIFALLEPQRRSSIAVAIEFGHLLRALRYCFAIQGECAGESDKEH